MSSSATRPPTPPTPPPPPPAAMYEMSDLPSDKESQERSLSDGSEVGVEIPYTDQAEFQHEAEAVAGSREGSPPLVLSSPLSAVYTTPSPSNSFIQSLECQIYGNSAWGDEESGQGVHSDEEDGEGLSFPPIRAQPPPPPPSSSSSPSPPPRSTASRPMMVPRSRKQLALHADQQASKGSTSKSARESNASTKMAARDAPRPSVETGAMEVEVEGPREHPTPALETPVKKKSCSPERRSPPRLFRKAASPPPRAPLPTQSSTPSNRSAVPSVGLTPETPRPSASSAVVPRISPIAGRESPQQLGGFALAMAICQNVQDSGSIIQSPPETREPAPGKSKAPRTRQVGVKPWKELEVQQKKEEEKKKMEEEKRKVQRAREEGEAERRKRERERMREESDRNFREKERSKMESLARERERVESENLRKERERLELENIARERERLEREQIEKQKEEEQKASVKVTETANWLAWHPSAMDTSFPSSSTEAAVFRFVPPKLGEQPLTQFMADQPLRSPSPFRMPSLPSPVARSPSPLPALPSSPSPSPSQVPLPPSRVSSPSLPSLPPSRSPSPDLPALPLSRSSSPLSFPAQPLPLSALPPLPDSRSPSPESSLPQSAPPSFADFQIVPVDPASLDLDDVELCDVGVNDRNVSSLDVPNVYSRDIEVRDVVLAETAGVDVVLTDDQNLNVYTVGAADADVYSLDIEGLSLLDDDIDCMDVDQLDYPEMNVYQDIADPEVYQENIEMGNNPLLTPVDSIRQLSTPKQPAAVHEKPPVLELTAPAQEVIIPMIMPQAAPVLSPPVSLQPRALPLPPSQPQHQHDSEYLQPVVESSPAFLVNPDLVPPAFWRATDSEKCAFLGISQEILVEAFVALAERAGPRFITVAGLYLAERDWSTFYGPGLLWYQGTFWYKPYLGCWPVPGPEDEFWVLVSWARENQAAFELVVGRFMRAWEDPTKIHDEYGVNLLTVMLIQSGWDVQRELIPLAGSEPWHRAAEREREAKLALEAKEEAEPKARTPRAGGMEVHFVPDDEKYIDETGLQHPYAWLPADGGSIQKDEESGPFGKPTKRRSKSKTGTPAKKEVDPTVLAADAIFIRRKQEIAALQARHHPKPEAQSYNSWQSSQKRTLDSSARKPSQPAPSQNTPTEVILYGFHPLRQWEVIDRYETAFGRICEDYARDPPEEGQKYKLSIARSMAAARNGPRTKAEAAKAMNYAGGEHWIKVTFESAEMAERAVASRPLGIGGTWVRCEYWRNTPPKEDVPIIQAPGEKSFDDPYRQATSRSQEPRTSLEDYESPFSYSNRSNSSASNLKAIELDTTSQNTMQPSYLANGPTTGSSTRRRRIVPFNNIPANGIVTTPRPREYTSDRYILRPAEEALLPVPSRWERVLSSFLALLPAFLTQDQIGDDLPVTDDGKFDWERATLYWRFWYYIDYYLGTDVLGMKEDY